MAFHRVSNLDLLRPAAHRGVAYSPYRLYFFGGFDGISYDDELMIFNVKDNDWEQFTELSASSRPSRRSQHLTLFLPPSYVFIFGGVYKEHLLNDTFLFNVLTYNWEKVTESEENPGKRYGMTGGLLGSTLFLFAGFGFTSSNNEQNLDDVWTFDYRSREWRVFNTLGTEKVSGTGWTCLPMHQQFFFLGSNLFKMHVLDVHTREWKSFGLSGAIPAKLEKFSFCKNESGLLYLFGGVGFNQVSNESYSLDEVEGNFIWHKLECTGNVPSPRYAHCGFAIGDVFFLVGGRDHQKYFNDLFAFNPNLGLRWLSLPAFGQIPVDRVGHIAFYIKENNQILIHGGDARGFANNEMFLYDYRTNEWTFKTSEDSPALAYHSSVHDQKRNRLVIFGGGNLKDCFSTLYTLALPGLVWQSLKLTKKIPPRAGHCAVLHPDQDQMIVFAGFVPIEGYSNELWSFSLVEPRWMAIQATSKSGTFPVGRVGSCFVVHNFSAYLIGGVNSEVVLDDLWKLDMLTWTWERISIYEKSPGCIFGHSGVKVGQHIFLLTGDSNDANGNVLKTPTSALLWSLNVEDCPEWSRYKVEGNIPPKRFYSAVLVNNDVVLYGGGPDSNVYQLDRNDVPAHASSDDLFRDFILPYSSIVDNLLHRKRKPRTSKDLKRKKSSEKRSKLEKPLKNSSIQLKSSKVLLGDLERLQTANLQTRKKK